MPGINLPAHHLSIALMHPQIAPTTGNIARLCVATGTHLHLVRPLGFVLSDKNLKRSAMDYWPRLKLTVHDDTESFFASIIPSFPSPGTPAEGQGGGDFESKKSFENPSPNNFWLFTTKSPRSFLDAKFAETDTLIFGSETAGLPESLLASHSDRTLRIPQATGERCLNLSTAAGIALYEALRQITRDV